MEWPGVKGVQRADAAAAARLSRFLTFLFPPTFYISSQFTYQIYLLGRPASIQGGLQRQYIASLGGCEHRPSRRRGMVIAHLQSRG